MSDVVANEESAGEGQAPPAHAEMELEPVPVVSEPAEALPTTEPASAEPTTEEESAPPSVPEEAQVQESESAEEQTSASTEEQTPAPIAVEEKSTPRSSPASAPATISTTVSSILARGLETIRFRKRAKLEKIVALAREKGSITNNDVQIAVRVSDTSATNYLNQLVVAGKLRRVGSASHATYEPV